MCYCRRDDSVIVILCRNDDKEDIKKTLKNFEEKFNHMHKYPYVFLNDKAWDNTFMAEIKEITESPITFDTIDPKDWNPPAGIDMKKAKKNWREMTRKGVPYAEQLSYHNMCRFFSRNFYKHQALLKYKYYWRIEPGVRFRCIIEGDPFDEMASSGFIYGFTIAIHEFMCTISSLGNTVAKFLEANSNLIPKNLTPSAFMFEKGSYNGCHFWSNFEIGDFTFFRDELYTKYADFLEASGGFYTERWGDAPVHSLAVALLADKSKLHFFEKIGYTHPPFTHCPKDNSKCDCTAAESVDNQPGSCLPNYIKEHSEL